MENDFLLNSQRVHSHPTNHSAHSRVRSCSRPLLAKSRSWHVALIILKEAADL